MRVLPLQSIDHARSPVVFSRVWWPNAETLDMGRPQSSVTPFQARIGVLLAPLEVDRQEILVLGIPDLLDRSRLAGSGADLLGSEDGRR